ncbi:MAG: T9SS type A sorting domain-containing protein, partial [Ignavibacteriae bacterium]|nr:T9SS type A sorting domain-containing protein [Ignavibacteriota bacterium]
YPNPFNPSTRIRFDVPEQSFINLKIYDYLGREIVQLVNENMSSGTYEVDFNTSQLGNLASGIYFYRIQTSGKSGTFVDTKRMILVK